MAVTHPRAVEAQPLTQLDDLQRRLVAPPGIGLVEQPDGQEAQLPQGVRGLWRECKAKMKDIPCALEFRHQSWFNNQFKEKTL
ncbi:hypothetical protein, partial [Streptomyces sp. NPDC096934]|uniref:hypothetical protein n=1 Tax=Streptomyces sp. NPDC096934 TaxID=3155551 RepID=UPI00332AEEA1